MAVPSRCNKRYSKAHQTQYNQKKSYDYDHYDNANTNIPYWENLSNNRLDISWKPELTICFGRQVSIDHHQKPGNLNYLKVSDLFSPTPDYRAQSAGLSWVQEGRVSKVSAICHCHLIFWEMIFKYAETLHWSLSVIPSASKYCCIGHQANQAVLRNFHYSAAIKLN